MGKYRVDNKIGSPGGQRTVSASGTGDKDFKDDFAAPVSLAETERRKKATLASRCTDPDPVKKRR